MKMLREKAPTVDRTEKKKMAQAKASPNRRVPRAGKERVLVEFPLNLLERTDRAASLLEKNRSELIRMSVERMLKEMERKKFEAELAAAYAANAERNIDLLREFVHADSEGMK